MLPKTQGGISICMREMSIEEILREEQTAVIQMAAQIKRLLESLDPYSKEYYLLQNDLVMLTQTAVYLERRCTGTIPPDYLPTLD